MTPGDHYCVFDDSYAAGSFLLHVPPSYDGSEPVPLVLVYHGAGGSGQTVAERTGFSAIADREGFIAVYPDRLGNPEQVGLLLDDLEETLRIDPDRVYATGYSNGGVLMHDLACGLDGRFAAFAPVAGSMAGYLAGSFWLREPVPALIIHGTADQVIPWDGREGIVLSVPRTVAAWVAVDHCRPKAEVTYVSEGVLAGGADGANGADGVSGMASEAAYQLIGSSVPGTDAAGNPLVRVERYVPDVDSRRQDVPGREVVLYAVEGGEHSWPTWASEAIWRFFEACGSP